MYPIYNLLRQTLTESIVSVNCIPFNTYKTICDITDFICFGMLLEKYDIERDNTNRT